RRRRRAKARGGVPPAPPVPPPPPPSPAPRGPSPPLRRRPPTRRFRARDGSANRFLPRRRGVAAIVVAGHELVPDDDGLDRAPAECSGGTARPRAPVRAEPE